MSVARRHHFISKCYLKNFGVLRKNTHQVEIFDAIQRRNYPSSIENVGVERDFNRFERLDAPPDKLEIDIAKIEGWISPALERTIESGSLEGDEDRAAVVTLMAMFGARNPRMRSKLAEWERELYSMTIELSLAKKSRWESMVNRDKKLKELSADISYEDLVSLWKDGKFVVDVPRERSIYHELGMLQRLTELLSHRHWTVLRTQPSSGGFVTSDHPLVLKWDHHRPGSNPLPIGFGLRNTEVIFALSKSMALVGHFDHPATNRTLPEPIVAAINGATILNAERQVIARDRNFYYSFDLRHGVRKASKLLDDRVFLRSRESRD